MDITNYLTASFKDPNGLSVWEGANAKSTPQQGVKSTQILGPIVTENGRKLIFYDLNQGRSRRRSTRSLHLQWDQVG